VSSPGKLLIERRGAADWLTLNRPDRLNAVDAGKLGELHRYLDALRP